MFSEDSHDGAGANAPLLPAVARKLKAPVQGTKEGKEDGAIGSLDVERLMQDSDSDARVDGRYDACDK